MEEVELQPIEMHWVEGGDPHADCCVHGGVYLSIGSRVVSDGKDTDWSISTTAFNFLRTVFHDHSFIGEEPLIPHCGFTMWVVNNQPDGLYMPNCDSKINWSINHKRNTVVHEFADGEIIETTLLEWSQAVCKFADEVNRFFYTAWPKAIDDEDDRKGFELFMNIWQKRRAAAEQLNAGEHHN